MEQHENKLISNDLQKTCRTCLTIKLNENDMKLIYDYCNVFSPAVNDVLLQKLNVSYIFYYIFLDYRRCICFFCIIHHNKIRLVHEIPN